MIVSLSDMTLRSRLWGVTAAIAVWLGFPNDLAALPCLALLWPVAISRLGIAASSGRQAFVHGWIATWVGMTAALYWLALPLRNVGELPWIAACACAVLVTACLSTAGGVFSLISQMFKTAHPVTLAAISGLAWYLLELSYAKTAAFPWLPLSGALAAWPLLVQAADIVGAYALSGLWVFVCLLCLSGYERKYVASGLVAGTLILAYGGARLIHEPVVDAPAGESSVALLFVEGNVDQNRKWIPSLQRQTVEHYMRLTRNGLARTSGDTPLIIWPETALPFFYEKNPLLAQMVRDIPRTTGCPLLFGAPGIQESPTGEEAVYNRAFLLAPDGSAIGHYDKERLVPFGEYVPAWLDFNFLSGLLQGVGAYRQGTATAPLRYENLALGMLICYEGIFPWLAQARVENGANILVDISNDGWFGGTPAALQHLYLTALRAVEQNRWVLRGTNTGISCVIDARGRVTRRGGQLTAGTISARAGLVRKKSPYHLLAPWLAPLAGLLLAGLMYAQAKR